MLMKTLAAVIALPFLLAPGDSREMVIVGDHQWLSSKECTQPGACANEEAMKHILRQGPVPIEPLPE
jgi:hypothetical protein